MSWLAGAMALLAGALVTTAPLLSWQVSAGSKVTWALLSAALLVAPGCVGFAVGNLARRELVRARLLAADTSLRWCLVVPGVVLWLAAPVLGWPGTLVVVALAGCGLSAWPVLGMLRVSESPTVERVQVLYAFRTVAVLVGGPAGLLAGWAAARFGPALALVVTGVLVVLGVAIAMLPSELAAWRLALDGDARVVIDHPSAIGVVDAANAVGPSHSSEQLPGSLADSMSIADDEPEVFVSHPMVDRQSELAARIDARRAVERELAITWAAAERPVRRQGEGLVDLPPEVATTVAPAHAEPAVSDSPAKPDLLAAPQQGTATETAAPEPGEASLDESPAPEPVTLPPDPAITQHQTIPIADLPMYQT